MPKANMPEGASGSSLMPPTNNSDSSVRRSSQLGGRRGMRFRFSASASFRSRSAWRTARNVHLDRNATGALIRRTNEDTRTNRTPHVRHIPQDKRLSRGEPACTGRSLLARYGERNPPGRNAGREWPFGTEEITALVEVPGAIAALARQDGRLLGSGDEHSSEGLDGPAPSDGIESGNLGEAMQIGVLLAGPIFQQEPRRTLDIRQRSASRIPSPRR